MEDERHRHRRRHASPQQPVGRAEQVTGVRRGAALGDEAVEEPDPAASTELARLRVQQVRLGRHRVVGEGPGRSVLEDPGRALARQGRVPARPQCALPERAECGDRQATPGQGASLTQARRRVVRGEERGGVGVEGTAVEVQEEERQRARACGRLQTRPEADGRSLLKTDSGARLSHCWCDKSYRAKTHQRRTGKNCELYWDIARFLDNSRSHADRLQKH